MAAPPLGIQVQPLVSGKATYLPLGATTATGAPAVKIVLRLRLENTGTSTVRVNAIRFAFPGSTHATKDMQGVNMDGGLDLGGGAAAVWSNGRVDLDPDEDATNWINNSVYLTGKPPAKIRIEVGCRDYTDPATVTLSLIPHESPVPEKSYRFPYAAGELRTDEYYSTSAVHWANGGANGTQIFAHDISVVGWDAKKKKWSQLVSGGDRMKNEDYRIWDKPVRAIADGIVEDWVDGLGDNTITADADGNLQFPSPAVTPRSGNSIRIQHGTELVSYSHLRSGSIPSALMTKGVKVSEGQLLGRVGNTGNSTNPHTHLECVRTSDSALRPLPFRNAHVIDGAKLAPPGATGPWFLLQGQGIPENAVMIWPGSTHPGFPVPAAGIAMAGDWANSFIISSDLTSFSKTVQDLYDKQGRRLMRVGTYLENGKRRWVGIARAGTWASRWWISTSLTAFQQDAQKLFDEKKLRLIYANSFVEGGKRKFIGIAQGGDWASRLIVKDNLAAFSKEAQTLFDEEGKRLVHVNTWVDGGKRRWFGIARSGTWASRWWISPNLGQFSSTAQKLFDEEGKRLTHVTTYVEAETRRWVGIARSGTWANSWFFRSDLDSFSLEAQRLFDDRKQRLVHVEILE